MTWLLISVPASFLQMLAQGALVTPASLLSSSPEVMQYPSHVSRSFASDAKGHSLNTP